MIRSAEPTPAYKNGAQRIAERVSALNESLSSIERAQAVARIEPEEAAIGTQRAVAGFDLAFSIPKSASILWAVANDRTQELIAEALHAAVAETVAQVEMRGVIATAYDHYDSRAGDPHLYTHIRISNRVQIVLDGKWRSPDSRPMHAATVALPEMPEAVFIDRLARAHGVEWEQRDVGLDRNPGGAIYGVPDATDDGVLCSSTPHRHRNRPPR